MNMIARGVLVGVVSFVMAGFAAAQAPSPQSPADFGDRINILQIPAAGFQPRCSAQGYDYSQNGFIYFTNNPCTSPAEVMWAPGDRCRRARRSIFWISITTTSMPPTT